MNSSCHQAEEQAVGFSDPKKRYPQGSANINFGKRYTWVVFDKVGGCDELPYGTLSQISIDVRSLQRTHNQPSFSSWLYKHTENPWHQPPGLHMLVPIDTLYILPLPTVKDNRLGISRQVAPADKRAPQRVPETYPLC